MIWEASQDCLVQSFFSSHSPSPVSHVFILQIFSYLLLLSCQYNENAYIEHPI